MAQFYQQCQEKGYTDMSDATQSLKAKVIATDMNLKYGDISAFYKKAKQCRDEILAEQAAAEREQARRNVDGTLLVTLDDLAVYVRPDGSSYTVYRNGEKEEGTPAFEVSKGAVMKYVYRPAQATYSSATVGGITTGGVTYTEEGYDTRVTSTNKGSVRVKTRTQDFSLHTAVISSSMAEAFKRDPDYQKYTIGSGKITFSYFTSDDLFSEDVLQIKSYEERMNIIYDRMNDQSMPYDFCVGGVKLLERIIRRELPPTDEELYQQAASFAQADSSANILAAARKFETIADYNDSAQRAKDLLEKYEVVLQAEKEQAILDQEAQRKRIRKCVIIGIPAAIIGVLAILLLSYLGNILQVRFTYKNAVAQMESGQYLEAIESFNRIPDYLDSAQLCAEAERAYAYQRALDAMEQKNYAAAVELLDGLHYLDSEELYIHAVYQHGVESYYSADLETAKKMFRLCEGYLYTDDMCSLINVAELYESNRYMDAILVLRAISPEFIAEHQNAYDEMYASYVWGAIQNETLSLKTAITLMESMAEPYLSDAASSIQVFKNMLEYEGKYRQIEDDPAIAGSEYLTISFVTNGEGVNCKVSYTGFDGTLAAGTAAWNFNLDENGDFVEYPVKITTTGRKSGSSKAQDLIFRIGDGKAKTDFNSHTFIRID